MPSSFPPIFLRAGCAISPPQLPLSSSAQAGILTEETNACGSISREDVATLVIKALLSDKANNKTLSALDPTRPMMGANTAPKPFVI